jgi:acyl carrier protein
MSTSGSKTGGTIAFIRAWLKENKGVDESAMDVNQTFVALGMDSIEAMTLVGDLEDELGRRLSPTLAWDHPTPRSMSEHLDAEQTTGDTGSPAKATAPSADGDLLERLDELSEEEIDRLLAARMETQSSGSEGSSE